MNDVQKKLYQLLLKFDARCRENNIVYYLGGGSTLGAMRHRGFLPWDDDVDLYMTRSNYDKLLANKDKIFSEDFVLVNHTEYPRYGNTLVRCVDTNSTSITKARILDGTPKGQFVEIFIMDPMPKDPTKHEIWLKKHWIYAEIMATCFKVANPRIDQWIDEDLYYQYQTKCEQVGREATLKELESELFSISESSSDQWCSRWGLRNLIYDIDCFQAPRYVPFEDTVLPVPTRVEEVLRFDYGDTWMIIPEEDNQITHTFAESMTISYRDIVNDYCQLIDADNVWAQYAPRKQQLMKMYFESRRNHTIEVDLKQTLVDLSLKRNLPSVSILQELAETNQFQQLLNLYSIWIEQQKSSAFWEWRTAIQTEEPYLYYVLLALLMSGDYSAVRRVSTFYTNQKALSAKTHSVISAANAISDAYNALISDDTERASQCINQISLSDIKYLKTQFDYCYIQLYTEIRNIERDSSTPSEETFRSIQSLVNQYQENGDVIALYADALRLSGDTTEARLYYQQSLLCTRNGFTLMHVNNCLSMLNSGENA